MRRVVINPQFAKILSSVFKDLAVAFFIAAFISPTFSSSETVFEALFTLTKNMFSGTLLLLLSWRFATLGDTYEQ